MPWSPYMKAGTVRVPITVVVRIKGAKTCKVLRTVPGPRQTLPIVSTHTLQQLASLSP